MLWLTKARGRKEGVMLKIYRIFHHRMTQLCKSLQISFLFLPLLSAAVVRAFPSVRVKCRVRQFSMIGDQRSI